MPLFFSYLSTRIRFTVRKYRGYNHTIDHPVDGVKSRFGYSLLLYYKYRTASEFRGYGTKVLLRKNIIPSFKDIEYKETFVPSLSV
jgi:hypothetical protein